MKKTPTKKAIDNLIPIKTLPTEEAKRRGALGGKQKGINYKERRLMSQLYGEFLEKKYKVQKDGKNIEVQGSDLIAEVIKGVLAKKDGASVSMMREIREATEGNNLKINADINNTNITEGMSFDERKKVAEQWLKNQR